jgi:LysM repeat protein
MKNDSELEINHDWSDDQDFAPKRRLMRSGNTGFLRILLAVLLILVFLGGIFYFLSRRSTDDETNLLQSKLANLEQKISSLEKQITELQGKVSTLGPDPVFLQQLDALAQKVEALEKQKQPVAETKAKSSASPKSAAETKAMPSAPSKPAASIEKQYHTVQKGDTLYRISKKYGISVEELRKLNNLSGDQALRTGQKLLVSPGP